MSSSPPRSPLRRRTLRRQAPGRVSQPVSAMMLLLFSENRAFFALVPPQQLKPLSLSSSRLIWRMSTRPQMSSSATTSADTAIQEEEESPGLRSSINQFSPVSGSTSSRAPSKLCTSTLFGDIYRIQMPGEEFNDDDGDVDERKTSFVGAMGVPTFAAVDHSEGEDCTCGFVSKLAEAEAAPAAPTKKRGLEGALMEHGPAFVVDRVLPKTLCDDIISDCEDALGGFGQFNCGRNHHGAMQMLVTKAITDAVSQRLAPHINVDEVETLRRDMITNNQLNQENEMYDDDDVRLFFAGLNRRWRIYKYNPFGNETFAPHIDASFPPSGLSQDGQYLVWDDSRTYSDNGQEIVSRLTVLMYLSDDFVGGATNFYLPLVEQDKIPGSTASSLSIVASVRPVTGSVLFFPQGVGEKAVDYARQHWPLHEGSAVLAGNPKYVLRSDALFVTERQQPPFHDNDKRLFQYDSLVRSTFLLRSRVWDESFLSHANLLYNPHMGVENLGPLLYSFIRFTKVQRVCEIGAGFTTLWILQAMKDNDIEMARAHLLHRSGQCRLLDIDWTVHSKVEDFIRESARLLCIDNCDHQKETATGARAVAKTLGLSQYLEFRKGDAFDLDLGAETLDLLWCDFGVGARMKDFVASAWKCLRPGGFLLCHSTLTNENTRQWLEDIRTKQPTEVTGIPPEDYVELSLLEPHKYYQNAISILQKRKNGTGDAFQEPIYSQFA